MSKILLLSATEKEHEAKQIHGIPIHIIGVGKVNAAVNTCRLIQQYDPEIVVNFGSCGNLKDYKIGKVLRVGKVVNDIDTCGFYNQQEIKLGEYKASCVTTDHMYDSSRKLYPKSYMKKITENDIVDMELFSIAKACQLYNKKLDAYKWVSDDGSDVEWLQNAKAGFQSFISIFPYVYMQYFSK